MFVEGAGLEERINDNSLLLLLVAQLGGKVSKNLLDYIKSSNNVISGLNYQDYEGVIERQFLNE